MDCLQLLKEFAELQRDVQEQKKCRRCKKRLLRVTSWEYVRRESLASPYILDGPAVMAMSWSCCSCGALHLGESLPARGKLRRLWSETDAVVRVLGSECPIRETKENVPGRVRSLAVEPAGGKSKVDEPTRDVQERRAPAGATAGNSTRETNSPDDADGGGGAPAGSSSGPTDGVGEHRRTAGGAQRDPLAEMPTGLGPNSTGGSTAGSTSSGSTTG